jgi:hypothetical protein
MNFSAKDGMMPSYKKLVRRPLIVSFVHDLELISPFSSVPELFGCSFLDRQGVLEDSVDSSF